MYTGGLGGYALSNMIIAHLQHLHTAAAEAGDVPCEDVGELLLGFLKYYGRTFDYGVGGVMVVVVMVVVVVVMLVVFVGCT